MKKVVIYCRVSTQDQADEGYSIQEQQDRLRLYCQAHDWTLVHSYVDPGFSGANINRPALQQLLRDIRSGAFDTVLVYKLDRLSRSQKDTAKVSRHHAAEVEDFLPAEQLQHRHAGAALRLSIV